jgi:cysteine desulfurase/selenocysteine lyase
MAEYDKLLSEKTKIVATYFKCTRYNQPNQVHDWSSTPMEQLFWSMERAVPHLKPNMQELDCDFMFFRT